MYIAITSLKFDVTQENLLMLKNFSGINPLRPNYDLSETPHCNIRGLSVSEVMRIENMIAQVKILLIF